MLLLQLIFNLLDPLGKTRMKNIKNFVDNLWHLYYTAIGIEAWLSLVERCVRDAEAACSNHVASIKRA